MVHPVVFIGAPSSRAKTYVCAVADREPNNRKMETTSRKVVFLKSAASDREVKKYSELYITAMAARKRGTRRI
jgi:hypothetical protein